MVEAQDKQKKTIKQSRRPEHGFGSGTRESAVDFNSTWNGWGWISNAWTLIIVQQDASYSVYYISVGSSTRFGCWHPPSSGARTAVITASATGQLGLLPSAVVELDNFDSRCTDSWI